MTHSFTLAVTLAAALLTHAAVPNARADEDETKEKPRCYYEMKGKTPSLVKKYNEEFADLGPEPDIVLEGIRLKMGLPIALNAREPNDVKYADRLEGDDITGGVSVTLFLKQLKVRNKSGVSFDTVYEVAGAKGPSSSKVLRKWNVPYNWAGPEGVSGDKLFFPYPFRPICPEKEMPAKEVTGWLELKTNGDYMVIEKPKLPAIKRLKPEDCTATKIFKMSDYGACAEFTDETSKKKRILVWQSPMT